MNREMVTEVLKKIVADNNGFLRPEDLVRYAQPEESILHDLFEWNDSEAAHNYRLEQARRLMRVCVQFQENDKGEKIQCRVFVSLTTQRKGEEDVGYKLLTDVLSSPEFRGQLLEDARREMRTFQQKFNRLEELSDIFMAMRKFEQT